MPISIDCRCGYTISAPERLAGRTLRCPKCLGEFTVPQVAPAPLAAVTPLAVTAPALEATLSETAALPSAGLPAEQPFATAEEPAFEMAEEAPDLAALETHAGPATAPETPLALSDEDLAPVAAEEEEPLLSAEDLAPAQELSAEDLETGVEELSAEDLEATQQEVPVMDEDELGMFLMEDEAPAEK